jgi:hypothetical protein
MKFESCANLIVDTNAKRKIQHIENKYFVYIDNINTKIFMRLLWLCEKRIFGYRAVINTTIELYHTPALPDSYL